MASRPATALPRKRPVQKRAELTNDALLIAVERVLEEQGVAGLTTNRVAEVAGVSVGSLYQYYPNKEALVRAVAERYIAQTFGVVRALLAAAEGVPVGMLCDRLASALLLVREQQRPIHRWLTELRTQTAFQDRYRELFESLAEELAEFLAKRADLRFDDPRAAAWVLVHAMQGIVEAVSARGRSADVAPVAAAACDLVRTYLVAHAHDREPGAH